MKVINASTSTGLLIKLSFNNEELQIIVLEDKEEYIRFTLKEETETQELHPFDLVKDRDIGNSKGYGFCIYQDPAVTDIACAALNGLKMDDKTLTVHRATTSGQQKLDRENVLAQAQQHIALQKLAMQVGSGIPGLFTAARGCMHFIIIIIFFYFSLFTLYFNLTFFLFYFLYPFSIQIEHQNFA